MSVKYKIGDISKLLGIPVQTLRYYEEQDIVKPHKDKINGYRYYDAWDLNNLIDTVHYRALDFSVGQTEEILNKDDLEVICTKYREQESILLEKIETYKSMLKHVSRQRQRLSCFFEHIGKYEECSSPDLLFYRHRLKDTFQSKDGDLKIDHLKSGMKEWMAHIPNITPTFMVISSSLGKGCESMQYWWGWSMPMEAAQKSKLQINEQNEYLPSKKCLYTVFEAYGKGSFAAVFYEKIYRQMALQAYPNLGNPIGRLIVKTHDGDGMHRYFEVWIPLEDKKTEK